MTVQLSNVPLIPGSGSLQPRGRRGIRALLVLTLAATPLSSWAQADPAGHPTRVLWGDTHIHTALSGDAVAGGTRLDADTAYRFARGETVQSNSGQEARLGRPLDFAVVADHGNNMGAGYFREKWQDEPAFRDTELGKAWAAARDQLVDGHFSAEALETEALLPAHRSWQTTFRDSRFRRSVWNRVTRAADAHNQPGEFTAFIGYEWTPGPEQGSAQHRVVVFADDAERANQVLPFTSYDSAHEEDLWRYLDRYERLTGGRAISIPHNGNLTNGAMFSLNDSYGLPLNAETATQRARFEPVVEVTQIKGDSETHPLLSPDDTFADYETWNSWSGRTPGVGSADKKRHEYTRSALMLGLQLGRELGVNPFRFGMIGSSDAHTGLAGLDEDNFWGKAARSEPSAGRIFSRRPITNWEQNAAGYAAVWAMDNSRSAIFEALLRKETYASTGPRMTVRFFGGFDFVQQDLRSADVAATGYARGVPMGGDLRRARSNRIRSRNPPTFLVAALKDPRGANLDRLQIVKGWRGQDGELREKVHDVVWSDDRVRNAAGSLPAVGNTVDMSDASYSNSIGEAELRAVWADPDFRPDQAAFYYVRVLEIPTPRWTLYDKVRYNLQDVPAGIPMITQERAYTSPIWYDPNLQ